MTNPNDDDIDLIEDDEADGACSSRHERTWRILVVDDDLDVHEATRFALAGVEVVGRQLELLHATSGQDALLQLQAVPDVAVILLDVVMESDDAGLRTVEAIRNQLKMLNVRIVLRTGQPGQAPELTTITQFDINDYKTKGELTQARLLTTLISAVRSYDQLERLEANRRGLEKIVSSCNQFMAESGLDVFAEGVITQLASLIGVPPEGLVCAAEKNASAAGGNTTDFQVIAAAGHYRALMRQHLSEIKDVHIVQALSDALMSRRSVINDFDITLYFKRNDGEGFAAYIESGTPIREVDQHLLEVFCTNIALCAQNIDLIDNLRRDALIDRQLGLPNRNALLAEMSFRLEQGSAQYLAVLDVDQFAAANDMLGHQYGDALLTRIVQILKDGFDERVFLARVAADAFALVGDASLVSSHAIQSVFSSPFLVEGIEHLITVSVGVALLDGSAQETLKNAYVALRRAKSQGIGQSVDFSSAIGLETRSRALLLHDLRHAFDHDQLYMVYQPQVDLVTGWVVGFEALMRWKMPDGSAIPPDKFIPVAEQSGLIVNMGRWLFRQALHDLHRFCQVSNPKMRMAINVSAVQLRQPDFLEYIDQVLKETSTLPENLEIEITETVALENIDAVASSLKTLRDQGIKIAIDDFGTGYSSLHYLGKLPVDNIKIDRSFVLSFSSSERGASIVKTIALLGNELQLHTVAEGVEDEGTGARLRDIGYHYAQGYHYARPMTADELIVWLQRSQ